MVTVTIVWVWETMVCEASSDFHGFLEDFVNIEVEMRPVFPFLPSPDLYGIQAGFSRKMDICSLQ